MYPTVCDSCRILLLRGNCVISSNIMRKERRSAVDRVLDILLMFAGASERLSLQSVAKISGRSRSSVYRYLQVLRDRGFIEESETPGHYRLGSVILALANNVHHLQNMISQAEPIMRALSRQTGESILLTQRTGAQAVVIASLESPQIVCVNLAAAKNVPLHVSSIGKVHLAFLPDAEAHRILSKPLRSYTPKTISNSAMLESAVRQVRQQGYAVSESELEVGAKSVSAPIWYPTGQMTAALTVAGPAFRLTALKIRKLIPEVIASAQTIAKVWAQKSTRSTTEAPINVKLAARS